jgi:hypothetical protein
LYRDRLSRLIHKRNEWCSGGYCWRLRNEWGRRFRCLLDLGGLCCWFQRFVDRLRCLFDLLGHELGRKHHDHPQYDEYQGGIIDIDFDAERFEAITSFLARFMAFLTSEKDIEAHTKQC